MMRRYNLWILTALSAGLTVGLAAEWFTKDGQVRTFAWSPPAPVKPELRAIDVSEPLRPEADLTVFAKLLERPLFSPSRRPPPPPPPAQAAAPPPPPDPMAQARLLGIFAESGSAGGILIQAEGKIRRVKVNERIGPWTLKSLQDRSVTLARGAETRVLELRGASKDSAGGAGQPSGAAAAGRRLASPPLPNAAQIEADREARRADRIRRINERRAAQGLEPLPATPTTN